MDENGPHDLDPIDPRKGETSTPSSLPASFDSELPLAKDILSAKDRIAHATGEANPLPASRQKAAKGLAAYGEYVSLTGLNFGLSGIGLDPTTMELILPV